MSHSVSPDQAQTTAISETGSGNEETGYAIEDEDTDKNPTTQSEEEDEEKRQRSVLIDFNLPLLADGITGQSTLNVPNVPMVQGTPQIADAPTVPGTPSIRGKLPSSAESAGANPLILPDPEQVFTGPLAHGSHFDRSPARPPHEANKPHPQGTNKPHPQPSGCMVWLLVAIIVPIIILVSIIGVGFTLLAPTLSLDGSTSVTTGGILHLHGGHFIPGDSVTCILDGTISLTSAYPVSGPPHIVGALLLANQGSVTEQTVQTGETDAKTTIIVGGDGTFSFTFVVGQNWTAGQHTIRATEAFSPRSATTTFTITGNVQPTGTATRNTTPTTTKTEKATPSVTPAVQTKPGLNAITPNIITFGPISEGYTQPTSIQVLLNTTGADLLSWTASWDTIQAPWLRLNVQSGQIQEPGGQALIVSAVVGTLKAGTYNATILFSSNGKNELSLPISLTVQAGCLKATPATLNFTGAIGANDPAAQTLSLNNCAAVGNWSASTTGGAWLLVSPAGGNLNKGATQSIIVSAALANVKSGAGTYQGQIVFKNGAAQAIVNVIFTVLPPPTLGINTTSFSVSRQCTFSQALLMWQCNIIKLNSSKSAISNLNWKATSSGIITITVKPTGGTLQPGQTTAVEVDVARIACDTLTPIGTITFNGPANSVAVTMTC
jgi:hypothetical protein